MTRKQTDEFFMRYAIALANKARGYTSPNPLVGCVIVNKGSVVGHGYHRKAGHAHAEIVALKRSQDSGRHATLYVTLEPCNHFGKTPPCTDAIIKARISRVVIGSKDPNPVTRGRGIQRLKQHGIAVTTGVCELEARQLNVPWNTYITTGMPFITLKIAQSLDGKIATSRGESKWISCPESRRYVHRLRSEVDAVMVGSGTIRADDPLLLPRGTRARKPLRVIVDSSLSLARNSRIFKSRGTGPVVIGTTYGASQAKKRQLMKYGIRVLETESENGRVDLKALLEQLGKEGVVHVLVEGGAELAGSLFDKALVHHVLFFSSPKIIGGKSAVTSVSGKGIALMRDAHRIESRSVRMSGDDVLIEGFVKRR